METLAVQEAAVQSKVSVIPSFSPKLFLICHGGCGANAALAMMKEFDAKDHPHLYFVVIESNSHVLSKHFSIQENVDDKISLSVTNWLKSKQVTIVPLGKGIGAGGDPKKGEQMLTEKLPELKKLLEPADVVVMVGGGGGGTASGTMVLMANTLKEMGTPTYSILTRPRLKEGRLKIKKADLAMQQLLAICPTAIIYNENIPNKKLSYHDVWNEINNACLIPVLQLWRSLIQDVGDDQDIDIADLIAGMSVGNYTFPGAFDASEAESLKDVEKGLLGNPYLQKEILNNVLALDFWFEGDWTVEDIDLVIDCVLAQMGTNINDAEVEIKWGLKREGVPKGKKKVGFVAFAQKPPAFIEKKQGIAQEKGVELGRPEAHPNSQPIAAVPELESAVPSDPEDHTGKIEIHGPVGGDDVRAWVKDPDLAKSFNALFRGSGFMMSDKDRVEEILDKVQAETRIRFTPRGRPWINGEMKIISRTPPPPPLQQQP